MADRVGMLKWHMYFMKLKHITHDPKMSMCHETEVGLSEVQVYIFPDASLGFNNTTQGFGTAAVGCEPDRKPSQVSQQTGLAGF